MIWLSQISRPKSRQLIIFTYFALYFLHLSIRAENQRKAIPNTSVECSLDEVERRRLLLCVFVCCKIFVQYLIAYLELQVNGQYHIINLDSNMETPFRSSKLLMMGLFLLLALTASAEYRLEKTIKLSSISDILDIAVLNESALALRSSSAVHILSGADYQVQTESYAVDSERAQLSKRGVGVLDKDGSSLTFQTFSQQNYTFLDVDMLSDIIVYENYALIGKMRQDQPTLHKLNFDPVSFQTIILSEFGNWTSNAPATLGDLHNGDLVYGQDRNLLILDNETLEIKQMTEIATPYEYVNGISTYTNPETNESTFLISTGMESSIYSELKKDKVTGEYTSQYRFITQGISYYYPFNFILTNLDRGVGRHGVYLSYWNNFHSVIDMSYDEQIFLDHKQKVAVSYDQSFFVARNSKGAYQFFNVEDEFKFTLSRSVFINQGNCKKGETTSDDKLLFVSIDSSNDKRSIAKVDVKSGAFTFVADQNGDSNNQVDFSLFQASKNRLVTLAVRDQKYYIQLRALNDLSLVDELPFSFNLMVFEYKFVGNVEWDLTFGLGLRLRSDSYRNDSKLLMFKVTGDRIVDLNLSRDANFTNLVASYKYVLTFDEWYPETISVLHYSNLSLAFPIDAFGSSGFKNEKNIVILTQYTSEVVYNLSLTSQSLGMFNKDKVQMMHQTTSIIFPKKGALYESPTYVQYPYTVIRILYNISAPLSITQLSLKCDALCFITSYYIPPQKTDPECNSVFYVDHQYRPQTAKLVRYFECSGEYKYYPIDFDGSDIQQSTYISSDKKYVSILIFAKRYYYLFLEIRPIDSLETVIFHKQFPYLQSEHYSFGLNYYHVDIIGGDMIIIHYPEWVTLYFIEPKEFASKHSMTAITHYDLNDEKVVALAGPSINGKVDRIIVKAISSEEYLFSTTIAATVQDIALSQKEGRVAVCSSDSTVRVWDVSSKALIFERKVEGATEVEFRGENTLLIKSKDGSEEVRLDGETVVSGSVTAEVSSDGSTISVRSSKGELIVDLQVPFRGERFVSVTVSPSEGIIAATDANKLYVWTPKQTSQLSSEEQLQLIVE